MKNFSKENDKMLRIKLKPWTLFPGKLNKIHDMKIKLECTDVRFELQELP